MATKYTCRSCSEVSTSKKDDPDLKKVLRRHGIKVCPYCHGEDLRTDRTSRSDATGVATGKRLAAAFQRAKEQEELESEQASNIEVGDFLSELATAIRFRQKLGLSEGDWIEEPERYATDGLCFAREEAVASGVKLQITVSLDASTSMWFGRIMKHAGPAFIALDRVIRKAILDLPEGTVHYAPFIFHGSAFKIPASFLSSYAGRVDTKEGSEIVWPNAPGLAQLSAAQDAGEIPASATWKDFPLSGADTQIAPLFEAIKDWEERDGDTSAVRLDIVITDGKFEDSDDVAEATKLQEERNGLLRTVLLNFLPLESWANYQLPDRCAQFAVTADNLDTSIRNILSDAIGDLL